MKHYNVGDQVWYAVFEHKQVQKTCPVCFGKRKVTLILGNDEQLTLDCDYCGKGCESAQGYVYEHEHVAAPELKTITRIEVNYSAKGETRSYYAAHYILSQEDVFDNKEEAHERANERAAEYAENEATRGNHRKNLSNKSSSWRAGYWMREAKRCREEAELYEKYFSICKEKSSKTKENN